MGKESIFETIFLRLQFRGATNSQLSLLPPRAFILQWRPGLAAHFIIALRMVCRTIVRIMTRITEHHGRQQQLDWERSQYRAAQVSYRLERVRFVARLTLLSISWWAQYRRRRCCNSERMVMRGEACCYCYHPC